MKYGRHLKLTDTTIEKLCRAISIGAAIKNACAFAGVSVTTYYSWLHEGEAVLERLEVDPEAELSDREVKFIQFYNSLEKAQSKAAMKWLEVVDNAASENPGYALRMLKIRFPGDYDEVQKSEVDVGDNSRDAILETFKKNVSKIYSE